MVPGIIISTGKFQVFELTTEDRGNILFALRKQIRDREDFFAMFSSIVTQEMRDSLQSLKNTLAIFEARL